MLGYKIKKSDRPTPSNESQSEFPIASGGGVRVCMVSHLHNIHKILKIQKIFIIFAQNFKLWKEKKVNQ